MIEIYWMKTINNQQSANDTLCLRAPAMTGGQIQKTLYGACPSILWRTGNSWLPTATGADVLGSAAIVAAAAVRGMETTAVTGAETADE